TGGNDGEVRLWDPTTGKETRRWSGHKDWVWQVAWSRDGKWLASTSIVDNTVRIWDPTTGKEICSFSEPKDWMRTIDWSPDSKHIAMTGHEEVLLIWTPPLGRDKR